MLKTASITPFLVGFCSLLLVVQTAVAAGPVHADKVSAGELTARVRQALDREGYLGSFRNGQDLQRGLSAYLWDNRNWLQKVDFHNLRSFDVAVCLLQKKGYAGFDDYLKNELVINWCNSLVRQP